MTALASRPDIIPRGALIGAAGLVGFTIMAAMVGHMTGIGTVATPRGTVVESRELRFEDAPDGAVLVRLAGDNRVVDVIAPGTNHFVRSTLRGLARTRRLEHIGSEPPFRLSRLTDGRLTIEDPTTRRLINLDAFGRPNAGAFGAILASATRTE